jgi:hypothetical protein
VSGASPRRLAWAALSGGAGACMGYMALVAAPGAWRCWLHTFAPGLAVRQLATGQRVFAPPALLYSSELLVTSFNSSVTSCCGSRT